MELAIALLGLLTALLGVAKAVLELLRSRHERENLNNPGIPQHLKGKGRRR